MAYSQIRKYNTNIHIYECTNPGNDFDITLGKRWSLEQLSKLDGEPEKGKYAIAKVNGGYYNTNGSAEYLGSFVDEGLYYGGSTYYIPTFIYWKDGTMTVESRPTQTRHAYYQQHAYFAIGLPWALIIDGKKNYLYDKETLIAQYSHPYTYQPRTLIGQKEDGTIVLVVADGRSLTSTGLTIDQSADLMLELGCVIAGNADGGGSSEMIVNGVIKNNPSDGRERSLGNAFLIYAPIPSPIYKGVVELTDSLNVRYGPGTSFATAGSISAGTEVEIIGTEGDWYQVVLNDKVRYVHSAYINITESLIEPDPEPPEELPEFDVKIDINENAHVIEYVETKDIDIVITNPIDHIEIEYEDGGTIESYHSKDIKNIAIIFKGD